MRKLIERRVYSESIKRQIANEVEKGLLSIGGACRHYNVPQTTVRSWVEKYCVSRDKIKTIEVVMKDQEDQIKELKSALADAYLKMKIYDKMLELAGEDYGFEVKKNTSTGQLELVKKRQEKK